MKTIKGAIGSKSNLLKWLALPFLMLVAFLNIEIGGGSMPGSETRKSPIGPDIGGNSTPRAYVSTTGDIGGGQETRKSPIGPNIVGNYATVSFITFETEIGGQGSVPPRAKPIGGSQVPPRRLVGTIEIGGPGNQGVPRQFKPVDIGGGGVSTAPRNYAVVKLIGGNGGQETRKGIKPYSEPAVFVFIEDIEIGGNGTPLPPRRKSVDIGGQSTPRGFACQVNDFPPIGGSQTSSRLLAGDIGGSQTCPRCYKAGSGNNSGNTPRPVIGSDPLVHV